ncbi:MAG: aminotransferase class V-fold PLP-dependent enzyme, partial [Actinomycetes bacterium]
MLPEAVAAMTVELAAVGNASSLHTSGRRRRRVVEESRELLASALGARPSEVVLTAGGTESDNLAVKGLFWARREQDPRRRRILASAVEHHAVTDALEWLAEHEGADVVTVPVDDVGRVDLDALRAALAADPQSVALVTVMWANNEV